MKYKISGSWNNDLELHERSQVQEMLNRLAEESIRRMEMVCIAILHLGVRYSDMKKGGWCWSEFFKRGIPRPCFVGVA